MGKNLKVARGFLEEEKRKEDIRLSNQRIALIMLPIIMVAVLLIGIFFGFKNYRQEYADIVVSTPDSVIIEKGSTDISDDELILTYVNSSEPLDKDFVPDLISYSGVRISPIMKENLSKMLDDARKSGEDIILKEGYVSYDDQQKKYEEAIKKYRKEKKASVVKAESQVKKSIPSAGESEQQTGLVVYLTADTDDFSKSSQYFWLMKHAVDYGFVLRYEDNENIGGMGYNSHLFRYVGAENAMNMRVLNLNFEEYVIYLEKH